MVKIVYSKHAKKRLFERPITKLEVRNALSKPDYIIKRSDNEIEAYKTFRKRVLKVVYIKKANYIKIITLYWLEGKNEIKL